MKIILACASGMSTGMLVKRMEKAASEKGIELEIGAYAVGELQEVVPGSSAILLGPQVSYKKDAIQAQFPDIPVAVINMMDYGMMNGEKILNDLLQTIG